MSAGNGSRPSRPSALAGFSRKPEGPTGLEPLSQAKHASELKPLSLVQLPVGATEETLSKGSLKQLKGVSLTPKPLEQSSQAVLRAHQAPKSGQGDSFGALGTKTPLGAIGRRPDPLSAVKPVGIESVEVKGLATRSATALAVGKQDAGEEKTELKQLETTEPADETTDWNAAKETPNDSTQDKDEEFASEDKETEDSFNGVEEFACMSSSEDEDESRGDSKAQYDDLYDSSHTEKQLSTDQQLASSEPVGVQRMIIPKSSREELFHAITCRDITLLTAILSKMSPDVALQIRDRDQRTMYHYAAASSSPNIQAVVFQFIACFYDEEINSQVERMEATQQRLESRHKHQSFHTTERWVSPGAKQLQRETTEKALAAYSRAIEALDSSKRSFLHYGATNLQSSVILSSAALARTLKRVPRTLLLQDNAGNSPLDYAVMSENTTEIDLWFKTLGIASALTTRDVDKLATIVKPGRTQQMLQRLLESSDLSKLSKRDSHKGYAASGDLLGLGVQFRARRGEDQCSTESTPRMRSSLHSASIFGNESAAQTLIDQGQATNAQDADGWTPLHHCMAQGTPSHVKLAEHLLQAKASVDARSLQGRTPLHVLAMHSPEPDAMLSGTISDLRNVPDEPALSLASLLVDHGADLEARDEDLSTPLIQAVKAGNISMALFLLKAGCDRMATDKSGSCVLHIAVARGYERMTQLLAWWDAESPVWRFCQDHQGRRPMAVASSDEIHGALDNLWYGARLVDPGQVRRQLHPPQHHGPRKRDKPWILGVHDTTFVAHRTALHLAVEGYLTPCASGSRVKTESNDSRAVRAVEVISLLLSTGAKASARDKWGITPLMLAATCDTVPPRLLQILITSVKPQDLLVQDDAGNTALHYSYAFSRAKASSLLEDAMEDAELENHLGQTPLMVTGLQHKIFPKAYRESTTKRNAKSLPSKPMRK